LHDRCAVDPWHTGTAASLLGVIATAVVGPHAGPPAPFRRLAYRGARGITITGNSIDGWFRGPAISIGNGAGATVRDNTIAHPPTSTLNGSPTGAAVAVCESEAVAVEGNAFIGPWSSVAAAVSVDASSTSVDVRGNTLRPGSAVRV
jgi:hypothetical protein